MLKIKSSKKNVMIFFKFRHKFGVDGDLSGFILLLCMAPEFETVWLVTEYIHFGTEFK